MTDQLPTLDPEVTYLDASDAPAALYRVVVGHLADERGPACWVDARNRGAPAALYDHLGRRACRSLAVARAFTGYQHYELVRSLPGTLRATASLVVAPALAAPYADPDVPDHEADAMVAAVLELLDAVSTAVDVPVLVTADADPYAADVRRAADRVLDATATRMGLRVDGDSVRVDGYWDATGFQTTVPYWVDRCGAVGCRGVERPVAPAAVPGV
jgi:hypothetical protein